MLCRFLSIENFRAKVYAAPKYSTGLIPAVASANFMALPLLSGSVSAACFGRLSDL